MPEKSLITVYLPIDMKAKLDQAAKDLDRPRNWCIVKAIEDWLRAVREGQEKQNACNQEKGNQEAAAL